MSAVGGSRPRRYDRAPVAVKTDAIGKRWPPTVYEVGSEKIREYAHAVGETAPVHHDREAALAAGFRDVVAPPMFCVVYSGRALFPALFDPAVGIDFASMLHAGQAFDWAEPVCSGDTVTTTLECAEIYEKGGNGFYVFESVSLNQDGNETVRGTWTNIVRGV
jgi:acyl dehydratase